jgi:hypothetical protein
MFLIEILILESCLRFGFSLQSINLLYHLDWLSVFLSLSAILARSLVDINWDHNLAAPEEWYCPRWIVQVRHRFALLRGRVAWLGTHIGGYADFYKLESIRCRDFVVGCITGDVDTVTSLYPLYPAAGKLQV